MGGVGWPEFCSTGGISWRGGRVALPLTSGPAVPSNLHEPYPYIFIYMNICTFKYSLPPPPSGDAGMGCLNDMWGAPPPPPHFAEFALDVTSSSTSIPFCTLHIAPFKSCTRGPPVLIALGAWSPGEQGEPPNAIRNEPQHVSCEETLKEDKQGEIRSVFVNFVQNAYEFCTNFTGTSVFNRCRAYSFVRKSYEIRTNFT